MIAVLMILQAPCMAVSSRVPFSSQTFDISGILPPFCSNPDFGAFIPSNRRFFRVEHGISAFFRL